MEQQSVLQTTDLMIGYHPHRKNAKLVAGPLNLTLASGQLICLLGPNGCGKSTLLRTVSGLQGSISGEIFLQGKSINRLSAQAIAKELSLVLTENVRSGNLDVYTLISLGRYPHSGWLGILNAQDKIAIDHAVTVTGTAAFLHRKIDSLSDGECQKVMLARAIAQDTPLIILDEPTAHLDLPSRIHLMRLLHRLAADSGKAILISTHELDLALQVADQVWLMDSTGYLVAGLPEELILNGKFQQAFDKDGILFDASSGSFHIQEAVKASFSVTGKELPAFWTRKALTRNGFIIDSSAIDNIDVADHSGTLSWTLQKEGNTNTYFTLKTLLAAVHH